MSRIATAAVCQPLATRPPNERLGPGGVVEVERLRIELGREGLDPLGAQRDLLERPEAKTDREVFEGAKSWPHRGLSG